MYEVPTGGVPRTTAGILFNTYDGKGVPGDLNPAEKVDIRLRDGSLHHDRSAIDVRWSHLQMPDDVVAWRRSPRPNFDAPFAAHDGKGCPPGLDTETPVDVHTRDGATRCFWHAGDLSWVHAGQSAPGDIVYWRRAVGVTKTLVTPAPRNEAVDSRVRKRSHYFKDVSHLDTVDVYRVLSLFNVTDQALGHAIKKLLVAGGRGAGKDVTRDVQEAADTLQRFLEMRNEDCIGE